MSSDRWRVRIEHATTFIYSSPVRASYNEVRQVPRTLPQQTVLQSRVHTTPHASQYLYEDYWGNQTVAFNVGGAHQELVVRSTSLVETGSATPGGDADWEAVAGVAERHAELTVPSRFTAPDEHLVAVARDLRRPTVRTTVNAVAEWTHAALRYEKGTTHVHTSAVEACASGSGVCQDFAHLALTLLRVIGIPARYVSGYLHSDPEGEIGQPSVGESHAWVEAWVGGWWGFDPSNDVGVGPGHVLVALGRDYSDVPPVKGIFAGTAEHSTSVSVTATRVM